MGVFFAAPDANVASSASKLSCLSVTAEPTPPTRRSYARDATTETTQTHTHRYAVDATIADAGPRQSGRRKKKSGSMSATVAVGGTLPAWSHFIMPSGLFAYL